MSHVVVVSLIFPGVQQCQSPSGLIEAIICGKLIELEHTALLLSALRHEKMMNIRATGQPASPNQTPQCIWTVALQQKGVSHTGAQQKLVGWPAGISV